MRTAKVLNKFKSFTNKHKVLAMLAVFVLGIVVTLYAIAGIEYATRGSRQNQTATPTPQSLPTTTPPTAAESQAATPEKSTPAPQTTPKATSSSTAQSAPTTQNNYTASQCTKTPIAFETIVNTASQLEIGTYKIVVQGINGYKETCSKDSMGYGAYEYTQSPTSRLIDVGTSGMDWAQPTTTKPNPGVRDRIYASCQPVLSGTGNQKAYNLCVSVQEYYFQNWLGY